jgi:hypothetical protein
MNTTDRRTFLAGAATLGAAATVGAALPTLAADSKSKKQLVHHVFFWLKNPDSTADRDQLVAGVRTLGAIETVRLLHVGVLASTEKRPVVDTSWQVSELMFFDSPDAQAAYQAHPIHLAFVKNCGHLWSKVVVYDAQGV